MTPASQPCLLPNSHSRLRDFHRLWHQTLDAYSDPEGFRANLNAAIQASRSVTFLLQSEKAVIPQFDQWYDGWQGQLRSDPLMKWLCDARTEVVHRADLETLSKATVRIHDNLDFVRGSLDIPARASTEAMTSALIDAMPTATRGLLSHAIISVERKWVSSNLPNHELLEALAYAFSRLHSMLDDAHTRCTCSMKSCSLASQHDQDHFATMTPGTVPPCMSVTRGARTMRASIVDGRPITFARTRLRHQPRLAIAAMSLYGLTHRRVELARETDPYVAAEQLMEVAKQILAKDGFYARVMWLRDTAGNWFANTLVAENHEQKYALMHEIAEEVERRGVDCVIDIGEFWISSDSTGGTLHQWPEDQPGRREALQATVAGAMLEPRTYVTEFARDEQRRITFGDTHIAEMTLNYLEPIMAVWRRSVRET